MPIYSNVGLEVLNNGGKNGKCFTFYKFLDLIVRCSKTTFQDNLLEAEMFCLLLERMELSKGFSNFEKKTYRPHTSKITLLPSKQTVQMI